MAAAGATLWRVSARRFRALRLDDLDRGPDLFGLGPGLGPP